MNVSLHDGAALRSVAGLIRDGHGSPAPYDEPDERESVGESRRW